MIIYRIFLSSLKNMSHNNDNDDNTKKKLEVKLSLEKTNDESQLNEPGTSRGYLNEKNINENNFIIDNDKTAKRSNNKRAASPDVDDSLADFKLPKLTSKPYLSDNKIKLSIIKSGSSSRGGKKRGVNRKKPIDKTNQSLLFKSPINYRCPLCLKSFSDISIQTAHTKNCAAINNVSTEQLLAAAELHERQAEERLAIGLPAAPYQQPRKKSFNIKKMNPEGDPDIQLAIALSKSLSEIEERENFDEALALAAESNENLLQMSSTQRKSTLQNFGFITNKQPIVESSAIDKPRRKKNIGPTILQTRTQETRERLLSDKIAEILVGNEGILQTQLRQDKVNIKNNIDSVTLQSCVLKKMHEENNKLWNQSSEIEKHTRYYVEDLCEFIPPIVELTEIKLNDKNDEDEKDIEDNLGNRMDIVEELENNSCDLKLDSEERSDFKKEINSLALNWSRMINSNAYSDIIIHVRNNRYIYCHEIVLWTRCQSILHDVVFNDDKLNNQQRKKIHWVDFNFSSAIGFLEFIYCGEIIDENVGNNRDLLIEINDLAKRYKVDELLIYLNEKIDKATVYEENKSVDENIKTISQPEVNIINCCNEDINSSNKSKSSMNKSELFIEEISKVNNYSSQNIDEKSPNVSRRLQYSCVNTSPDMFEDTEMFNSPSSNGKKIDSAKISQSSGEEALDALVNLVNDNELLDISENDEFNENIEDKLSETPKKYLRLSSTCPESSINSLKVHEENEIGNISRLCSTMKRTKSNMSAFIDKVRRKNKKGILDSDSDSETSTQEVKNYQRNPFKIRNFDHDSLLLDEYHRKHLKDNEKLSIDEKKEKKSALTLLEDDIRACLERNHNKLIPNRSQDGGSSEIFEENDKKNNEKIEEEEEEESNIFSDAESDDENDESMYTKYKRTHKNNSIGNYRSILKNLMKENFNESNIKNGDDGATDKSKEDTQINSDNDNENIQLNSTTLNKHEISTVNKIRLAELSAFDIYETMTPNSSSLHSSLEDSEKSKSFSSSKTPIELVDLSDDENTDEFPINKSSSDKESSEMFRNTSGNKSKGINSSECLNQDLEFDNWSDEMPDANDWQPLTQSVVKDKSLDENFEVSENKQNDLLKLSLNITDSIDLTQSDDDNEENIKATTEELFKNPSSDTITENVTKILKEYGVLDSTALNITKNNAEIINNSKPIVLSSSSETESLAGDFNISDNFNSNAFHENLEEFGIEADFEDHFMQSIIEGDSNNLTPFGSNIENLRTSRLCINEKNITFRSKQSINSSSSFRNRSINNINNDLDDDLSEISLKSPTSRPSRCSSVSPRKQKNSTRLLLTKSRSEGFFTPCKNKINNDNLIIPTNELLLHLNLSSENCEISIDVSPRENYSAMSSPELNKRLAEYGLRNQKHHRAVKLLNYVYNQMHPLVPEYLVSSCRMKNEESSKIDRDIEFDNDKVDREFFQSDGESSDDSSVSNSSEIPEEMMNLSDEEDYSEKDVVLVRECFQKLLHNDRVLHNKVLMYEPIPLESIHEKLKNEGIKSGIQLFADYLDDECISFYIENPKKGQRHVRRPKIKKKK